MRLLDLNPRPDAVFVSNDMMAFGCIRAIRSCGLRLPDDISIVGFDDIILAQASSPPDLDCAADRADGRADHRAAVPAHAGTHPPPRERQRILLKPELVIRDSCKHGSLSRL